MATQATTPIAVRSPYKAVTTEIEWADGHVGLYPHDVLRGYCPCAGCQGHANDIAFIETGDREIKDIAQVGGYALQITWNDGHDSGIYTFEYLRSLCQCASCVDPGRSDARPVRPR